MCSDPEASTGQCDSCSNWAERINTISIIFHLHGFLANDIRYDWPHNINQYFQNPDFFFFSRRRLPFFKARLLARTHTSHSDERTPQVWEVSTENALVAKPPSLLCIPEFVRQPSSHLDNNVHGVQRVSLWNYFQMGFMACIESEADDWSLTEINLPNFVTESCSRSFATTQRIFSWYPEWCSTRCRRICYEFHARFQLFLKGKYRSCTALSEGQQMQKRYVFFVPRY